jgi:hypothetical protein
MDGHPAAVRICQWVKKRIQELLALLISKTAVIPFAFKNTESRDNVQNANFASYFVFL